MSKKADWDKITEDITEINKVVSTCPQNVQEKCFELLFNLHFGQTPQKIVSDIPVEEKVDSKSGTFATQYKIPGNVLALMRKSNISPEDLGKLFMLDHEPILPTYNIDTSKTAAAQLQKVFMVLLENALTSGTFKADYSDVRDTCKEAGLYDSNFTANLRKNHKFFKGGAITEKALNDSGAVELSGDGSIRMAEIIKELCQK